MHPNSSKFFEATKTGVGDLLWILLLGILGFGSVKAGRNQNLRQAYNYLATYHPAEDKPATSLEKWWFGVFFESNQLIRAFLLLFLSSCIILGFILLCVALILLMQNPNQLFQIFNSSAGGPISVIGPAGFAIFFIGIVGLGRIMAFIQGGGRGISILQRIDLCGFLLLSVLCLILAALSMTLGEDSALYYMLTFFIGSIALGVGFLFRLSELQE